MGVHNRQRVQLYFLKQPSNKFSESNPIRLSIDAQRRGRRVVLVSPSLS